MIFENKTPWKVIDSAIHIAKGFLVPESIMDEHLTLKNDWKYDSIKSGKEVSNNLILINRKPIEIFTYRPFNPWSKAIGHFDGKAIHLNIYKLPKMNEIDIASNLLHEYAHYCGYTHGNNFKTKYKCDYSVPYYISENVKNWI